MLTNIKLSEYDCDLWSNDHHTQLTLTRNNKIVRVWSDSEVTNLVEDNLIHPDNLLETLVWYADSLGLL